MAERWVTLRPRSINRMLITILCSLPVPSVSLNPPTKNVGAGVRRGTSSGMSLLKAEEGADRGEPGLCGRRDETKNFNETDWQDQSFYPLPFRPCFSLLFSFGEKWQSSVLITAFPCALSFHLFSFRPISF